MKFRLFALIVSWLLLATPIYPQSTFSLGKGLLWEISGNGLKKKSYVLGTIHIIPANDYFFPKYYSKALKSSENLVMEINMTDIIGQLEVMKMAMMKDKQLSDFYDDSTYNAIVQICRDTFNINIELFKNMKPIFVQQQLATGDVMGNDTKSYELELVKMGMAMDKVFGGLETAKEQMTILDSIPLQEQADMLLETVKNIRQDELELKKLIKYYKDLDLDSLYSVFEQEDNDLNDHESSLLGNRNRKWIPVMETYMQSAPTFFAVGAGHLGGEQGVINLLRLKGYKVTAILK